MESNFNKYNASTVTSFGVPYDYGSVMHYGEYAFSKNGNKTIEPKVSKMPVFIFGRNLSILRQNLRFFIKATTTIKTQNNKEIQVVRQKPLSPKA
jgi:hypothetical protein